MALNEACQLWIEQEIDAGRANGENPHAIGKRVAQEIKKLFETKMNPRTIEQRARRQSKDATNVASKGRPSKSKQKRNKKAAEAAGWDAVINAVEGAAKASQDVIDVKPSQKQEEKIVKHLQTIMNSMKAARRAAA